MGRSWALNETLNTRKPPSSTIRTPSGTQQLTTPLCTNSRRMINLANTKLGTSGLTPSGLNLNNNLVNNLITTYAETNVANLRSFDIQNKNTGQIYGTDDDEDDIDNIDTRNGNISSFNQTFKAKNYS